MEERVAQLRQMPTSHLIALIVKETVLMTWALGENWEETFDANATAEEMDARIDELVRPLLIAIGAEIDRRIPVPT